MNAKNLIASTLVLTIAAGAYADVINATITADNHYALYTGNDSAMTFIGRNELGAGGAPGSYNWSNPETWSFTSGAFIYIAAWSDDSIAQGLLAQITGGSDTYNSGDARWQVYPTFANQGDGATALTPAQMVANVATANSGNLWQTPYVGGQNGISPWGTVNGISSSIRWMWVNNPNQSNPLQGGSGYGETLIFRMAVPAPGAAAVMGLGGVAALRRKRR